MPPTAIAPRFLATVQRLRPEKKLKPITDLKNVVLYEALPVTNKIAKSFHLLVVVYLVTLGNFGHLIYTRYAIKVPDQTERDESIKYKLAPKWQRIAGVAVLSAVCGLFTFLSFAYPTRVVSRLTLLQDGNILRIETNSVLSRFKVYEYPLGSIWSKDKLFISEDLKEVTKSTSSQLVLMPQRFLVFRDGQFRDPVVWDRLFYRHKNP